jgi:transcriptional accessory protein Tex/SPT6
LVETIIQKSARTIKDILGDAHFVKGLKATDFISDAFGLVTVNDIFAELEKPGRDPRPEFKTAAFVDGVETIGHLKPDMILEGVVTNVANFGAFVDVGVHQDGLVHISALSNTFVKDPRTIVKVGDVVKVKERNNAKRTAPQTRAPLVVTILKARINTQGKRAETTANRPLTQQWPMRSLRRSKNKAFGALCRNAASCARS